MVSNITQIIAFFIEISLGIFGQKSINEKIIVISNDSRGLNSPLSPTTWEKILDTYSGENWRNVTWIDRGVIDTSYLQHHPFLVIHGQMKSGKTREAAELIRCAVEDGIIPSSQVFDLTVAMRQFTPEEISSRLSKELRCEMRTLFFLNEIPADASDKYLEALSVYLQALRTCSPGYFITTVRSEHLDHNPLLQKWLAQNQVAQVPLTSLTTEETNRLINELRVTCAFPWNEVFRQEFINCSNGTPYHLILTFQRLNRLGNQVNCDEIRQVASQSLKDIWAEIRREMEKIEPAATSLFIALAICHQANITPLTLLVFPLASWIERKKKFLNLSWKTQNKLSHVTARLKVYGVYHEEIFVFPDVAVDSLQTSNNAYSYLDNFLRKVSKGMNQSAHIKVLFELGNSYYYHYNQEKAILVFQRIVKIDSKLAYAWYNLGWLFYEQGRVEEAEKAYHNALATNPQFANAWYNLGILLKDQRRVEEAEDAYRNALAANPQLAEAWSNLGVLFKKQERVEEAEEAYHKALIANPKDADIWSNLGVLFKKEGRIEEAEEAYRKALTANPQHAIAWCNLGVLLKDQGREEEAEEAYNNALTTDSQYAIAWFNLGALLDEQKRTDEAEIAFRKGLSVNIQDAHAWFSIGILYRKQERFIEARDALQEAVHFEPEVCIYHSSLGAVYNKLSMFAEAEHELRLAQQLSESDSLYNRACIAALAGDEDQAFSLLKEALDNQEVTRDWVRQDPDWDELRQDPRYLALVENEPASET